MTESESIEIHERIITAVYYGAGMKMLPFCRKHEIGSWSFYGIGKKQLGRNTLIAMHELAKIGVNINWILTGKGEMKNG